MYIDLIPFEAPLGKNNKVLFVFFVLHVPFREGVYIQV